MAGHKFASALVLALVGMALPPLAPFAAAQVLPGALDLNGRWELAEHGARSDPGNPIVKITHSGVSVVAEFISGAKCSDGQARPDLFIAELVVHPTNPPTGQLSSPAMWVCSNDPGLVKKCGGAIKPSYKTTFTNAAVDPDYIAGPRVTQGVRDCRLDASENGTAPFSLRRLVPCEFEQLMVTQRDNELLAIVHNTFIPAAVAFRVAIDAARKRFNDQYGGMSTNTLSYPDEILRVAIDDVAGTEGLAAGLADVITSSAWTAARVMAEDMGLLADPPLIEAQRMVEQMNAVEQKAPDARRAIDALASARAALQKCLQAPQ